jgi:anti-anti-sigma factor
MVPSFRKMTFSGAWRESAGPGYGFLLFTSFLHRARLEGATPARRDRRDRRDIGEGRLGEVESARDRRSGFSCGITLWGDAVVVSLAGELDISCAAHLRRGMVRALASMESPHVVVDLRGVGFCDSSGLSILVSAAHSAEAKGGRLELSGLQPRMTRVLSITGLNRRFRTFDTIADAVGVRDLPGDPGAVARH